MLALLACFDNDIALGVDLALEVAVVVLLELERAKPAADLCLSLPEEQLQKNGWPKVILRRAMTGVVPDAVRWRRGKEHLGYRFNNSLYEGSAKQIEPEQAEHLRQFLSTERLQFRRGTTSEYVRIEESTKLRYFSDWMKHVTTCK